VQYLYADHACMARTTDSVWEEFRLSAQAEVMHALRCATNTPAVCATLACGASRCLPCLLPGQVSSEWCIGSHIFPDM
jgi:late competence protein required for DNA uptake (superfamily II DNA/RNA helicase)